jgi:hypothetical protein
MPIVTCAFAMRSPGNDYGPVRGGESDAHFSVVGDQQQVLRRHALALLYGALDASAPFDQITQEQSLLNNGGGNLRPMQLKKSSDMARR